MTKGLTRVSDDDDANVVYRNYMPIFQQLIPISICFPYMKIYPVVFFPPPLCSMPEIRVEKQQYGDLITP